MGRPLRWIFSAGLAAGVVVAVIGVLSISIDTRELAAATGIGSWLDDDSRELEMEILEDMPVEKNVKVRHRALPMRAPAPTISPTPRSSGSHFALDIDTGSYNLVRDRLAGGRLPRPSTVRVEELVNHFPYDMAPPRDRQRLFSLYTELAPAPWPSDSLREEYLLQIGIKAREIPFDALPAMNLVFLVDTSGSMEGTSKLGLAKQALTLLAERMRPGDRISIATFAGAARTLLDGGSADRRDNVQAAIDSLLAEGATNLGHGLHHAYDLAQTHFIEGGINRVVIVTDGGANRGRTHQSELIDLVETRRERGVALSVLGVGRRDYRDGVLEQIADHGNGNYAYLDNIAAAGRVLISDATATLMTLAKDVKIRVKFNKDNVLIYRRLGYRNRALTAREFVDRDTDGGELGAGHSMIVYYQLELTSKGRAAASASLADITLHYQARNDDRARSVSARVDSAQAAASWERASHDFRFGIAVAAFAMALGPHDDPPPLSLDAISAIARNALGTDPIAKRRRDFLVTVRDARAMYPPGEGPRARALQSQAAWKRGPKITGHFRKTAMDQSLRAKQGNIPEMVSNCCAGFDVELDRAREAMAGEWRRP